MAFSFTFPDNLIMGEGALEQSKAPMKKLGKKALIITGKIVARTASVQQLVRLLSAWGIDSILFDEITGEPTDLMINASVRCYQENACDFCIGIGGGSPLDSAKATVAAAALGGNICDYAGTEIDGTFPPLVLIPTTAGTGSEATKFTVITDTKNNVKLLLKGNALLPTLAVVDPSFTLTAPPSITAATGMDALTHAVEAYTSRKADPLTDVYALSAIEKIFTYLPVAYHDGSNAEAREALALASFEAGVCINNSSVTVVHGMSRPIGALFHVPHGISNAMLIEECLLYVLDGCYGRFADIARAIGASTLLTDEEAAASFIRALGQLCRSCEIPTLKEYGIDEEAFFSAMDKMAEDALASGSPGNTVKELNKGDLIAIYKKLW